MSKTKMDQSHFVKRMSAVRPTEMCLKSCVLSLFLTVFLPAENLEVTSGTKLLKEKVYRMSFTLTTTEVVYPRV